MAEYSLESESVASLQDTKSETTDVNLEESRCLSKIKKCPETLKIIVKSRNCGDQQDSASSIVEKIEEDTSDCKSETFYVPSTKKNEINFNQTTKIFNHDLTLTYSNGVKDESSWLKSDKTLNHEKKLNLQHKDSDSCYFIDASSLNDDVDVITTPTTSTEQTITKTRPSSRTDSTLGKINNTCVVSPSNNIKTMNLENKNYNNGEENKNEEPLVRLDNSQNDKQINKESLVVEIKEADSGESALHSPCPDNTKSNGTTREKCNPDQQEKPKIPSLIRRNTFELDASDESLSSLRQEYEERRQGQLVFQSSITQYSHHRVDGDLCFDIGGQTRRDVASASLPAHALKLEPTICPFTSLPVDINDYNLNTLICLDSNVNKATPPVSSSINPNYIQKPIENSPVLRHRTESNPVFSYDSSRFVTEKPKINARSSSSTTAAWVVDLSDNSCSSDSSSRHRKQRSVSCADKSQPSSLGYFVNFEELSGPNERHNAKPNHKNHRRRPSDATSERSYCEFFVDLSNDSNNKKKSDSTSAESSLSINEAKKNIFSMFIDLNEDQPVFSGDARKKNNDKESIKKKKPSSEEEILKPKSSVFMFIESDSPVVRRRTLSSSSRTTTLKRHSWNTDKTKESTTVTTVTSQQQVQPARGLKKPMHKRAHSLSIDRLSNGNFSHSLVQVADKLEHKQLVDKQPPEVDYDLRDTPPNSHVEILDHEEVMLTLKSRCCKELDSIHELTIDDATKRTITTTSQEDCNNTVSQDENVSESCCTETTRKSETFEVSSSCSNPSSSSEQACNITDSIGTEQQRKSTSPKNNKTNVKSINPKTTLADNFVRLSDLDDRPNFNSTMSLSNRDYSNYLSRIDKIESMQKANESLYEKLAKNLNNGVNDFEVNEAVVSESDLSSLQSSMGRSGQGSTEETETSTSYTVGNNRLGEDLLRMFLEEINPDVTIDVSGKRIRAHKCILSSRCQYFAAILSGGWIENSGNIISLQGYSYNAVHFALRHIYSGENCIPDTISIVELATLADMLCLEGLKEVIGVTLKVKYCHLFHKPCNGCAAGVLECLPLAAAYGLDEVYRKSLRWITRYFAKIWPSKEFATLPRELMDKCYFQHIVHMSNDNVLQTMMDCDKLLTTLPNVRWAEPVFRLVSNLVDASMKYLTDNFASVISSESFHNLDKEASWNIGRLEDHLLAAAERLPPEQACKSYSRLEKILNSRQSDDAQLTKLKWSQLFADLMDKIKSQVEKCLIRDAARAARTSSWLKMDLELRRRIQELACLVILPNKSIPNKRPSRHLNFLKKESKECQDTKVTSSSRTPQNRNFAFCKVKIPVTEHNDKTLKQQTPLLQTRKILNKPKTDPLQRKLPSEKLTNDLTSSFSRPKSWPNKIEVKSRYLEPRNRLLSSSSSKETPQQSTNLGKNLTSQRKKIIISSSDSSRTSSPAMRRATACDKKIQSKLNASKVPIKKDGKALSSDSLTGNSRLIPKKELTSKSCGITRPESPMLKLKDVETGLSIDSLAETKRKHQQHLFKKTIGKMDASLSTDSLTTDVTTITTPRSMSTNKSSPILDKVTIGQSRNFDRLKKSSPLQIRHNNNNQGSNSTRRPTRSLENSTAASRSRAAAVANAYHGSLNLRKSLLDAAKAPDIPNKNLTSVAIARTSLRQNTLSTRLSSSSVFGEKKDEVSSSIYGQRNFGSSNSPVGKRSPKSNVNTRINRSTNLATNKQKTNKLQDDKAAASNKITTKAQTTKCPAEQNGPKFLYQSSRSGTFLKDEPTILNKSDIETAAIDI